jgi:hypothetical protein
MLAVYLIRHADSPLVEHNRGEGASATVESAASVHARSEEVSRLGGGVGKALAMWGTETWLYILLLSVVYGAVVGFASCKAVKFALRKYAVQRCIIVDTC